MSIDAEKVYRGRKRSRGYYVVRALVRSFTLPAIAILTVLAIRWLIILLWAGFG